jgi:type I restriction enzyme S subunit
MKLTVDPEKANARYIYYYFRLPSTVEAINSLAISSGVPHINLDILRKFQIITPPASIQRTIAATLMAYDDLIEANTQRSALLERLAKESYREWFVRLRFRGHGTAKVVKGVPIGWSFDRASRFIALVKGKSYAGEEITDNPDHMPFISLKSFNRGGGYREGGLKFYSGRYKEDQVVRQNDVVVALTDMTQDRAVVGRAARIPYLGERGAVISLDAVKLVAHNINNTFLYAYMRHSGFDDFIKEFANGANVLHLNPELITKQQIIVPPRPLQDEFAQMVSPIYSELDALAVTNSRLAGLRDRLLPRLISGKLSVENLAIQFPPGMAEELNAAPTTNAIV